MKAPSRASFASRSVALCLLFVPALCLPEYVQAQPPQGYYFGTTPSLPDSIHKVIGGGFTVTVKRVATSELQRKLLNDAERLFPDTSSINRVASTVSNQYSALRLADAARASGERWWWESITGVLTPFALTGTAVEYYRRRIDELSSVAVQPSGVVRIGKFEYQASVDTVRADSVATHVVRMSIRWEYVCGPLCAVLFTKSREVFFRRDGSVLRVEGDGMPRVVVS